jgi:hypothetical protein
MPGYLRVFTGKYLNSLGVRPRKNGANLAAAHGGASLQQFPLGIASPKRLERSTLQARIDDRPTVHAGRASACGVRRSRQNGYIRDFFTHGPHTAKRTWQENAARTRANARADAERVKHEAHSEE